MRKDPRLKDLPPIETARLLLRALKLSDAADTFEYASDPAVTKYTFWYHHKSMQDSKAFISWLINDNFACWGVIHKENDKVIGATFLHSFDFKNRRAEVAFNLARKYWGHGYGTEVAQALISFGFEYWALNRIEGTCMVENVASARVMEKVGMTFEGVLRKHSYAKGQFHDMKLYSILRNEV